MADLNAQQGAADQQNQPEGDRQIDPREEKLAADFLKRIQAALDKRDTKEAAKRYARNRTLLGGRDPENENKKFRANLFFANLAMMRPQVYAKDPEFSAKPTLAVPEERLPAVRLLAQTTERVLNAELVKGCELKRRMKRAIGSCYTTSIAWLKLVWQENKRTDPLVMNQINDTQDELMRLQALREELDDPAQCQDTDLQLAKLQATLDGLRIQSEVVVSRGLVLDHVWSEDIILLDDSIREITDYKRSRAMAHRVWMTRQAYRERFGYKASSKAKVYTEVSSADGANRAPNQNAGPEAGLLAVWEVWDHDTNTIYHVCEGEKGFCDKPTQPDWTGERWYPFFLLAWNEVDGSFYPISDVELTEPLVREYNETRDDFVQDRRDARPFTVVRKGGSLTDADVTRVRNRQGNDIILVEGVGGQPIGNDLQAVQLGRIDPQVYATQPSRADMEMIIGGGDAARGSVLEAKTATEAEILSQGLRGRSAERQDITEDMLTELGTCALQICLRKMTEDEVRQVAGPDSSWPMMTSPEEVFRQIALEVRGGSTGKPDRLQDQDRWTKLLPVIEKTMQQVSELRAKGQDELSAALIELLRETLRRFEERLDIDQFMPAISPQQKADPAQLKMALDAAQQQITALQDELKKAHEDEEKTRLQVAAQLATSAQPGLAVQAFAQAWSVVNPEAGEPPEPPEAGDGAPQPQIPGLIAAMAQQQGPAQGQVPQQLPN